MKGCIPFTKEQLNNVYNSFTGMYSTRNKMIFLVGCWTGLRISDVLNLKYIDFLNNGNWNDTLIIKEKKNKKVREIPLGNEFKFTIRSYINDMLLESFHSLDDYLFTTQHGHNIKRSDSICNSIKRAARSAGMAMIPRKIGTHCMRKTFASMLLEDLIQDGLPIAEVFQILCDTLNQGDVRVTMKYVGWDKENATKYTERHTNRKLIND